VNIKTNLANKNNYGSSRLTSSIKYICIHYTGNDGDTDEGNGKYFKNNIVKASAHYFVDNDSVTQSVPDNYVAWSVGGKKYASCSTTGGGKYYGKCTNSNSISIELCDDVKNGTVYPSAKTIQNALELTNILMKKYNIPASNVIRHFDVTGKLCPAYWTNDAKWKSEFWNKLGKINNTPTSTFKPYMVKVTASTLNVRKGAGTNFNIATTIKKDEVYTIVEEKNGWGKLKSGAGWISLSYVKKC
jgi:N-acetylmuramoyl-L-alanine amidase CwlA